MALRCRHGSEHRVRAAIEPLGTIEAIDPQGVFILHRRPGVTLATFRKTVGRLAEEDLLEFATPVMRDAASRTRQVLTGEIVLRLKPGSARRTLAELEAAHGLEVARRSEFEPSQYVVRLPHPSGTRTLDVARTIDKRDDVESASPNFITQIKR